MALEATVTGKPAERCCPGRKLSRDKIHLAHDIKGDRARQTSWSGCPGKSCRAIRLAWHVALAAAVTSKPADRGGLGKKVVARQDSPGGWHWRRDARCAV